MATRPALAPTHALNGVNKSEMNGKSAAAYIVSLQGWYLSLSLISSYNSLLFS